MRVPTSAFSRTLIGQLQKQGVAQATLQEQLSSGQRITKSSDDPAAMSRVMSLEQEKSDIQQYSSNCNRALAVSQMSYSSVASLRAVQVRAGELVKLGGGVSSTDANAAYAIEANQMIEQTVNAANAKYGTEYLFGGTKTDLPPFTAVRDASGNITSVTYNGSPAGSTDVVIETAQGSTMSPFTTGAQNEQLVTFVANLVQLRDSLSTSSQTGLDAAETGLNSSEDDLLAIISGIGSEQTGLEADTTLNTARFASLQTLYTSDVSADVATTSVKLSQAQTSYSAALQSGAKMLQMSLMDYIQ